MGENAPASVGMSKIVIPFFDPESKSITPRAWLSFVEMARKSAGKKTVEGEEVPNWSDEVTCTNAILLLRGTGAKWIENLLDSQATELTVWEDFKKSFRRRFVKSLSLTEKLNLTELRMTATESVLDFYDRCNNNINLFYEEEWETLGVGQTTPGIPWGTPGVAVTEAHKTVSRNYHIQCVNIHLKLAFAAGLRDSIKRQTLIQPTDSLASIMEVAQRVEASQKEIKKEVALVEIGDSEEETDVEVGAVNYRRRVTRPQGAGNRSGTGVPNQRPPGGPPSQGCFYCFHPKHYKRDCLTRKNDRNKNIFRTNINAPQSKRQNASVEVQEAEAAAAFAVNNAQIDIADYLNIHSA